jgi:hypothetical protein
MHHLNSVSVAPTSSFCVCHVVINDCRKLKRTQLGWPCNATLLTPNFVKISQLIQELRQTGHRDRMVLGYTLLSFLKKGKWDK